MENTTTLDHAQTTSLGQFYAHIYSWMVIGLLVSAFFSYVTLHTSLKNVIFGSPVIYYGIVAIEIALLLGIQFLINKLPAEMSRVLFIVYAVLNGITLAGLFAIYSLGSITQVFVISAALFAGLAIIGFRTKKDLSNWRTVLFAGMIGVFVSSIVNIFLQNSMLDIIVSAVAILVFAGLTVYDNQVYKSIYRDRVHDDESQKKFSTLGALHMYVNFIMIFVNLLRFFGSRD